MEDFDGLRGELAPVFAVFAEARGVFIGGGDDDQPGFVASRQFEEVAFDAVGESSAAGDEQGPSFASAVGGGGVGPAGDPAFDFAAGQQAGSRRESGDPNPEEDAPARRPIAAGSEP